MIGCDLLSKCIFELLINNLCAGKNYIFRVVICFQNVSLSTQLFTGMVDSISKNLPLEASVKFKEDFEIRFGKDRATMSPAAFQKKMRQVFSFEEIAPYANELMEPAKNFLNKQAEILAEALAEISEEEETLIKSFMTIISKVWYRYLMTRPDTELNSQAQRKQFMLNYLKSMNAFYEKETFPQKLIDYIESIYVPEIGEIIDITPKPAIQLPQDSKQLTAGIPIFHQQEDIYEALKKYFPAEQQKALLTLLQVQAVNEKLLFLGQANQLADIFRKLLDNQLITGCLQKELIKWVTYNFEYRTNTGQAKAFAEKNLSDIISGNQKPCKNPLIRIEKDAKEKLVIVSTHKTKKEINKI